MANLRAISNVLKQLQVKKPELKEPLVPIRDWVQDPYYVGEGGVFKWNDGVPTGIYPYYQDFLCDLFEYENKYDMVVISGGIGGGKTSVGLYCFIRKLYEQSVSGPLWADANLANSFSVLLCRVQVHGDSAW